VKTAIELPDTLFRQAKAAAKRRGISLRDFFVEALRFHLRNTGATPAQPWMKAFGGLRELHRETKKIERVIDQEFERIDKPGWR
jgi:hypothetical protein